MSDFFNEVEEDLRADQVRTLTRKYTPHAIATVLVIVVAVGAWWGYSVWRDKAQAHASEAYDRGLKAMQNGDRGGASTAFAEAGKAGSPAYKALALMEQGAIDIDQDHMDAALKDFDDAAKASNSPIIQDAARLKAAFLVMDKASYVDIEKRLKPLTEKGRPFIPTAKEALAFAKLMNGDPKGARSDFQSLTLMLDAPQDISERAKAAVKLIDDGQADQLKAIVKAQAALPPMAPQGPLVPGAAPQ